MHPQGIWRGQSSRRIAPPGLSGRVVGTGPGPPNQAGIIFGESAPARHPTIVWKACRCGAGALSDANSYLVLRVANHRGSMLQMHNRNHASRNTPDRWRGARTTRGAVARRSKPAAPDRVSRGLQRWAYDAPAGPTSNDGTRGVRRASRTVRARWQRARPSGTTPSASLLPRIGRANGPAFPRAARRIPRVVTRGASPQHCHAPSRPRDESAKQPMSSCRRQRTAARTGAGLLRHL